MWRMARRSATAERIVDAARRRFNEQGYAATSLHQIAASLEISQGNLTYHFPTKRDLVTAMQDDVAERITERRATYRPDSVEDDYVGRLLFFMEITATYRFLLRDDAQIEPGPDHQTPHRVLVDDFARVRGLLDSIADAGLFRSDIDVDLDVLARALWVLGRYWMDHLNEMELRSEVTRDDQLRGVRHDFAVLLPNLTAAGRRRFEAALERATDDRPEA